MELREDIVRRVTTFDVPREEAWEAITELDQWLTDDADVELREGAEGELRDNDGTVRRVVVEEIVPGRRLALRWCTDDHPPSVVEVTLDDDGPHRTRMVVVEIPLTVIQAVGLGIGGGAFHGPTLVAA